MILSQTIDQTITEKLIKLNEVEKFPETKGRLTGSMLGQPLQWQVLRSIGILPKPFDDYTLRKFQRGNDVEEWLVKQLPGVVKTQKYINYRNCGGHIDVILNTDDFDFKLGIMPTEIKSVANAKFKRVVTQKQPDRGHLLQACFYAMAEQSRYFGIIYVATDDYRIIHWIFETKDYAGQVDQVIDDYEAAMTRYRQTKEIPKFVAIEAWQANIKYQAYPDYAKGEDEKDN